MAKLTKGNKADLICIVILLLLNPATWYLTNGPENVFPDSAAYIAMGSQHSSTNGLFYLPSWGHVDVGLVLPPLSRCSSACSSCSPATRWWRHGC